MLQIDKLYQKITNDSLIPDVEDFQKNNGVIDYQTFKYFYDMPVKSQGASRKKEL